MVEGSKVTFIEAEDGSVVTRTGWVMRESESLNGQISVL